eukprot:TRINITY_DN60078_c0_g1_i1.p1 TRINITY_DN60078_c0_g1~~TRINITY_DN60078_c0_g1_i1.p1  ORF type:complete len:650 (+),score=50.34 TRINITY_DN60078_c0_g1_i1:61-2010(+)
MTRLKTVTVGENGNVETQSQHTRSDSVVASETADGRFSVLALKERLYLAFPEKKREHPQFIRFYQSDESTQFFRLLVLYFCTLFKLEKIKKQADIMPEDEAVQTDLLVAQHSTQAVFYKLSNTYASILMDYHQFVTSHEECVFYETLTSTSIKILKTAFRDPKLHACIIQQINKVFRTKSFNFQFRTEGKVQELLRSYLNGDNRNKKTELEASKHLSKVRLRDSPAGGLLFKDSIKLRSPFISCKFPPYHKMSASAQPKHLKHLPPMPSSPTSPNRRPHSPAFPITAPSSPSALNNTNRTFSPSNTITAASAPSSPAARAPSSPKRAKQNANQQEKAATSKKLPPFVVSGHPSMGLSACSMDRYNPSPIWGVPLSATKSTKLSKRQAGNGKPNKPQPPPKKEPETVDEISDEIVNNLLDRLPKKPIQGEISPGRSPEASPEAKPPRDHFAMDLKPTLLGTPGLLRAGSFTQNSGESSPQTLSARSGSNLKPTTTSLLRGMSSRNLKPQGSMHSQKESEPAVITSITIDRSQRSVVSVGKPLHALLSPKLPSRTEIAKEVAMAEQQAAKNFNPKQQFNFLYEFEMVENDDDDDPFDLVGIAGVAHNNEALRDHITKHQQQSKERLNMYEFGAFDIPVDVLCKHTAEGAQE